MPTNKNSLIHYITEQRRYHDELTSSFEAIRAKIIRWIGAIIGLLAFLYAGAFDDTKTTQEKLFIPQELYGQVFYVIGLLLVVYALARLFHGASPNSVWTVAIESSDYKKIEDMSEIEYLKKLKNDYESARKDNILQHGNKFIAIRDSFYPMLIGGIILIVLRYFQ